MKNFYLKKQLLKELKDMDIKKITMAAVLASPLSLAATDIEAASIEDVLVDLVEVTGQVGKPAIFQFDLNSNDSVTEVVDLGDAGLSVNDQFFTVFNFTNAGTTGPLGGAQATLNQGSDEPQSASFASSVELFGRAAFVVTNVEEVAPGINTITVGALDPVLFANSSFPGFGTIPAGGSFSGLAGIDSGALLEIRSTGDTGSREVEAAIDDEFAAYASGSLFATLNGTLQFTSVGDLSSASLDDLTLTGVTGDFVTSFGGLDDSAILINGAPFGGVSGVIESEITVIPSPAAAGVGMIGAIGLLARRRKLAS